MLCILQAQLGVMRDCGPLCLSYLWTGCSGLLHMLCCAWLAGELSAAMVIIKMSSTLCLGPSLPAC